MGVRPYLIISVIMASDITPNEFELREKSRAHKRLMNKALHYLGRYQASRAKLREILKRFAKRKIIKDNHDEIDEAAITNAIEDVIALCVDYGYVNDEALAESRTRQAIYAGKSTRQISAKLTQLGVSQEVTQTALENRQEQWQDPEWAAILTAARKKKLGPFGAPVEFEEKQKQMAKLARAGFALDLIRKCLAIEDRQLAEKELDDAQSAPHP